MNNRQKLSTDQRGIMAIVVTVLIMTVLSITTLAMAKMARREQRQSLDATMSVQANYAVESGINDSVAYLKDPINPAISACTGLTGAASVNKTLASDGQQLGNTMKIPSFVSTNPNPDPAFQKLSLGGYTVTTSYTCALISKTTKELKYTVNSSSVADITVGTAQTTLTISWESPDGTADFRTGATCAPTLPASWIFTPMLRVDITNLSVASPYFRKTMADNTGTIYLNPCASAPGTGTGTFASGYLALVGNPQNPQIINGSCNAMNTPRKCTATISFAGAYSKLLVRLHSVYGGAANVSISAGGQDISGAQGIIDVTAKANDVVKRVRKTFSINPTGYLTNDQPYLYAIESQNAICKRLLAGVYNGILNPSGTDYDLRNVAGNDQAVCNPNIY